MSVIDDARECLEYASDDVVYCESEGNQSVRFDMSNGTSVWVYPKSMTSLKGVPKSFANEAKKFAKLHKLLVD